MNQDAEKYYLIFEEWGMNPNQWSVLLDLMAVLLAIVGGLLGFYLYKKQRRDNAKDAFDFFQSSLPELRQSIVGAIADLTEFKKSLDLDNFVNPILSASLNDKFLNKTNLVHLNRFYANNRREQLPNFRQLLIDSNFFGNYHSYITKEINYFRNNYLEKKRSYSKWQLLRSNKFFSAISDESESLEYKEFYINWVTNLNLDRSIFKFNDQGQPTNVKNSEALVENQIKNLAQEISPFIQCSESANEVSILADKVVSAYHEMTEMKAKIKSVLETDIARFETVLLNLNDLLE